MTKKASSQPERRRKRIFIVDDHPIFREGLAGVIRQQPNLTVCGEADTAMKAFEEIRALKPDLLLTDLSLPGKSGLDLLHDLRASHLDLPTLVISMHDETQYAERVLRAGGQGYIMKQAGPERVLKAIATVLAGRIYVSKNLSSGIPERIVRRRSTSKNSPAGKLTSRECEVFRLIGEGKDDRKIAGNLHVSVRTVSHHRAHIKEKLRLKNDAELVRRATHGAGTE